ncbi:hypothetical protein OO013_16920 [Mangrovivirga sp. M17]|uniref:Uncharacterized protein n=1 Tax=Mangrovivirga halotolerans TaxID=2993936 RepID=A0ABT3RVJ6_9BACT|nr:hypothetical protein [Mangrovivirga halotolerans]MCX2745566.1 hypothetical protein [Mangrovivirga halotolerans]
MISSASIAKKGCSIFSILFLITILSCKDAEMKLPNNICDQEIIMSDDLFENAPSDPLTIESTSLYGNCLTITFSAGGCDGSTWQFDLIGQQKTIPEGLPRHFMRLSLKDNELCEALIRKQVSFDLNPALGNSNRVTLTLTNNNEEIIYNAGF